MFCCRFRETLSRERLIRKFSFGKESSFTTRSPTTCLYIFVDIRSTGTHSVRQGVVSYKESRSPGGLETPVRSWGVVLGRPCGGSRGKFG